MLKIINSPEYKNKIETAWVIGGSEIYKWVLEKNLCHRVYLTRIQKEFECDTFLNFDSSLGFKEVR